MRTAVALGRLAARVKWELAIVAAAVLAVAGISQRLTNTSATAAMVFTAIGVLLGPLVTNEVTVSAHGSTIRTLAEATLTVVLFSDAARIKMRALKDEFSVPLRLLGVGLPLTIVAGAAVGVGLFPHLTLDEVVLLAIVLAPTDAALGQAVVTEPRLPSRVRQGLNVESGLNDGICVPLLLIALAVAEVDQSSPSAHHAVRVVFEEIGYGLLGGVAAGVAVTALVKVGVRHRLITGPWLQVVPVAGAGLAYGIAVGLGGSGFIAAFVAGAIFGALAGRESEEASRLPEEVGGLLGGVTFLAFGAVLLGPTLEHVTWQIALYAVLSLTLVRMVPVAVAMIGSGAGAPTVAFLGWFGPRGLASIVFAVIILEESNLPGAETILLTSYLTVGLSVFAHGISAAPLATRYARWYESHAQQRETMESVPAAEPRPRGPQHIAT
jgi:NhaP-type Na+/H+ or K+/H+ antiporter